MEYKLTTTILICYLPILKTPSLNGKIPTKNSYKFNNLVSRLIKEKTGMMF